jgi:predicted nucleic acid-binding protein
MQRPSVFVDSSAYYAAAVTRDEYHPAARATLSQFEREHGHFFTTRYVLAETHALIVARRRDSALALRVLSGIETSRSTTVVPMTEADEQRARTILEQYQDHLFSLTDALSFAVMERLNIAYAFTFDGDFAEFGVSIIPSRP